MTENTYNPVKKSRAPMIAIIAVAIVAVIGIAAFAVSGGFSSAPQSVIETQGPLGLVADGIAKTADVQMKAQEDSIIYKAFNGGSVELVLESEDLLSSYLDVELPNAALTAKLYSDPENMQFGIKAGMEVSAVSVIDALLTVNEDALTVSSDALLGTKVLGVGFENIVENFDKSVFGPGGSYSLDISAKELVEELGLGNTAALMTKAEKLNEKSEDIAADFCNMLVASLEENALIEETEAGIVVADEETLVTSVSVLLDNVGLPAVVEDVCIYIRDDQEFRSFLKDLFVIYEEMGMLEEMELGRTADEAMKNLDDSVNAVLADLEDFAEEMDNGTLSFVFHISEKGKYFVGMDMIVEDGAAESKVLFFMGPDPAAPEFCRLTIVEDDYVLADVQVVIADSDKELAIEILAEQDGDETLDAELTYDKTLGEYELICQIDNDENIRAKGDVREEKKLLAIGLDTIYGEGEKWVVDAEVIFRADDELKPGKYTDILLLSEDEFATLVGELTGSLMGLMLMLQ